MSCGKRSSELSLSVGVAASVLWWSPCAFSAGPHHFQKWVQGEIIAVDVPEHALRLRSAPGQKAGPVQFRWNDRTELFASGDKAALRSRRGEDVRSLQPGEQVSVLFQTRGRDHVAVRIVRGSAAGEAKSR